MAVTRSLSSAVVCTPKICEKGHKGGMILPIFGDYEQESNKGLRTVFYLAFLLWFFMGVAIVADVFMGAIEKITSKKKRVYLKSVANWRTVTVWNDTVANLTLMALGSSAPEIMLGVIEICGNSFYAGDLGPSTIVGSAAFNLFMITAVCVVAIPDGEYRTINDLGVFAVTAAFSILAYIWLYIIVAAWSPNIVTIPEAVITFLFFPVLVMIAFAADRGYFSHIFEIKEEKNREYISIDDISPDEISEISMSIRAEHLKEHGSKADLSDEQMTKLIEAKIGGQKRSRAHYRVGAIRNIVGGPRVSMGFVSANSLDMTKVMPIDTTPEEDDDGTTIEISFVTNKYVVMENVGTLSVAVELSIMGELSELPVPVCVQYFTKDGTATAPSDYLATQGELIFAAGELRKEVSITIIDDEEMEDDEQFYLLLASPRLMGESPAKVVARLGDLKQATVCILDDDNPGTLNFEQDVYNVTEDECSKTIDIVVHRKGGCAGKVSCHFFSEDDGAVGGKDFHSLEGVLEFEAGQATATIKCTILPRGRYEKEEMFRIILDKPTGGCDFAKNTDGGADSDICTVVIEGDPKAKDTIDNVAKMLRINWDKTQIGHKNWQEQFKHAIYVGGGDDEDDEEGGGSISVSDWVMHVLTVFWKVFFAFIPPADYCDGWISFFISLFMIGVVTIFIGDLASFLGCVMGCPDALTAITFVALGTSLPDTFASKTAATQDPYADASIGNVTGSNSVNVFLGIGLSWSAGAFYWAGRTGDDWAKEYPGTIDETLKLMSLHPDGGVFAVRSGDLGFSVIVFCLCASVAIFVLMLRRRLGIGELGGPRVLKYVTACFFIFLWFLYVGLSAFKTFQSLKDDPCW